MALMHSRENLPSVWDPMRELHEMTNRMNHIFGRVIGRNGEDGGVWAPAVDVSETDKEYRIAVEVPGVKKEDVHVKMQNGTLLIEGERKVKKEEKGESFHRVESCYGRFLRSFDMPEDADAQHIDARMDNGVLAIHIAKLADKKQGQAKEIAIK